MKKYILYLLFFGNLNLMSQVDLTQKYENGMISILDYKFDNKINKINFFQQVDFSENTFLDSLNLYFMKFRQKSQLIEFQSSFIVFKIHKRKLRELALNTSKIDLSDRFLLKLIQDNFNQDFLSDGKYGITLNYFN